MILLSELSRRRIRSINRLIRVGRNECVVVLRVDQEKVGSHEAVVVLGHVCVSLSGFAVTSIAYQLPHCHATGVHATGVWVSSCTNTAAFRTLAIHVIAMLCRDTLICPSVA